MTATAVEQNNNAIEAVREALRTDVIEVIRSQIAELQTMSREAAYEHVMSRPLLLDGCFQLFRMRPQIFREVVVDDSGTPVTNDNVVLRCGRTLGDAITLVVRAAAKRYFRSNSHMIQGGGKGPRAAETLYGVLSHYLRFDWQAGLIPNYIELPPSLIGTLGEYLLEFREGAQIMGLRDHDPLIEDGGPPLLLDSAKRLFEGGKDTLDSEVLWKVCQRMKLARVLANESVRDLRIAVSNIITASPEALAEMMPTLGGDVRRFTVFLFVVYSRHGVQFFKTHFGTGGRSYVIRRWMTRLRQNPIPPPTLAALIESYEAVINTATSELDDG